MPPLLAVVGPTASGKSALAMQLARRFPVEILVADARQVYRGMNIGTAKPTTADRASVPHHLLDLVDPDQAFTAADWTAAARALIPEIRARGHLPLVVGGNGLYLRGLLDGYDYAADPPSPAVRARFEALLAADGLGALVERLADLDPEAAARIDRHNPRRVVRALERAEARGDRPRAVQPSSGPYPSRLALIAISRSRSALYRRIDQRAAELFRNGLLDEVGALLAAGFAPELRALGGHGYAEAVAVLRGDWTLEQAVEVTARRTRQYAKRQLTWLRHEPRITWLEPGPDAGDALFERASSVIGAVLA